MFGSECVPWFPARKSFRARSGGLGLPAVAPAAGNGIGPGMQDIAQALKQNSGLLFISVGGARLFFQRAFSKTQRSHPGMAFGWVFDHFFCLPPGFFFLIRRPPPPELVELVVGPVPDPWMGGPRPEA